MVQWCHEYNPLHLLYLAFISFLAFHLLISFMSRRRDRRARMLLLFIPESFTWQDTWLTSGCLHLSQQCLLAMNPWPHPIIQGQSVSSVAQSCPTLCDPMNHSTPGLPVHHQLPEFTQTHVHRVSNTIQPSLPPSSPSPPAPNPSQHQSLFQWVNSSHEVAKVLEFQL